MDPNSTLIMLLEAIEDCDGDEATTHLTNILSWITRGGEPPNCQAAIQILQDRIRDETI